MATGDSQDLIVGSRDCRMCRGGTTVRNGSMLAFAAILVVVTTLGLITIVEDRTQTGS